MTIADVVGRNDARREAKTERGTEADRTGWDAEDLLVQQAQRGEMEAFDALVLRHRARVCALARFVLGSSEEAEDVTQETFVRAYEALPRYECRGQFRVWITTICANLCKNRMKARRPAVTIDLAEGALLADPAPGPEAQALARERAQVVRECLAQMGARDRLILGLHYHEQTPIEEIARIAGARAGAVKVALHRARQRLRVRLERAGLLSD